MPELWKIKFINYMSSIGCGDVAAMCPAISTSMSCGRASGLRLAAMLRVSTMALGAQQNDDAAAYSIFVLLFLVARFGEGT